MNKKLIALIVLGFVVVGAGSFFGGIKYAESKNPFAGTFKNFSAEQRMQIGANNINGGASNRNGAGFVSGDILAKDEKSITVKLIDGGSKIVFYSGSTQITKAATGTASDLEVGKTVTVSGRTNDDGSITAQTIQFRPEMKTQQ